MILTKNLQLKRICIGEPIKGRIIDGLAHILLHAENPFYFAPFPIDFFEEYEDVHKLPEFKRQWRNRNKYIIAFWIILIMDILLLKLTSKS